MDLADILTKDQILADLQATTRWEAIDELINNLVVTGKIKPENREAIAAVVKKRDTQMSTGIGTSDDEARSFRYGYGVVDENFNWVKDPGEKKVYFEVSDYSTSYVFYENYKD